MAHGGKPGMGVGAGMIAVPVVVEVTGTNWVVNVSPVEVTGEVVTLVLVVVVVAVVVAVALVVKEVDVDVVVRTPEVVAMKLVTMALVLVWRKSTVSVKEVPADDATD